MNLQSSFSKKVKMHVSIFLLLCLRVHGFFSAGSDTVSVKDGDSVTLHTGIKMNQEDIFMWFSNKNVMAVITGDLFYICTDVQCRDGDERFKDRLKLDNQTGSLTIMNIRTTDSGDYSVWTSSSSKKRFSIFVRGFLSEQDKTKKKIVKEEESVTLEPGVVKNANGMMTWYFNDILIAEINEDPNKTCTDVQCEDGAERFRDRLEVDHQTGSLTITNTRIIDSGLYKLQITSRNSSFSISSFKSFIVIVTDFSGVDVVKVAVSVKKGYSVTLHTDVETDQQEMILWYFDGFQIAEINGDQSKIFTDDWGTRRFRDRLKLDHQTGSLTISNTGYSDSGICELLIFGIRVSIKIFSATVDGAPNADQDEIMRKSVMEEESVTLDPGVVKKTNDMMTWYFNDIPIVEINEDPSKTCTDVQCEDGDERFRDRLEVNHQTGSLTIMNTRIIDSGLYKLQIINRNNSVSISSIKSFNVTVIGLFDDNDTDGVPAFVMEGDSVILHTGVNTNQQDRITWYFYDSLIAEISGDLSYICTDEHCEDGDERFTDRLKLDKQTGSLTIMNINNTYAGVYKLQIISRTKLSGKNFIVAVYGVEGRYIQVFSDESLTLDPGEVKKPSDVMTWYFKDTLIAEIPGDQNKICKDDQCEERFRDRLKLDHQTGSLTIRNTRTRDSGFYKLLTSSINISIIKSFSVHVYGRHIVSTTIIYVTEGDSVTLHTDVETNQQENIRWYFNTRIAEITGDLSFICTDVQCNNGTERFRGRLKLDHQTGSLTIRDIRTRDFGLYKLQISSSSGTTFVKNFYVDLKLDALCAVTDKVSVSVMEGYSVTLHTDFKMNQHEKIRWYFNGIRIAVITGDLSYTCTDVQCNEDTERFRDRLKLDHQTGSLTITNTRTTDSGRYDQTNNSCLSVKVFIVDLVPAAPAAQRDEMKRKSVKEGESITLYPGEIKKTNDLMTWYFNETLIAEITGDQSKICTDVQCKDGDEKFRDRLQVDHQTGSLTITNIDTTDLGLYKLQITSRNSSFSISSFKSFGVNVTAVPDSGLSSAAVAGICAAAVLLLFVAAAAAVIYHHTH
ncbi:uncharacterized protein LOC131529961 isoform X3 [Onychostoma macrolepis]|uniref:uncharacterized protein LOC131529961 isoform X3 n=1 Tax=Onychostoma macrolepis TaxID=369639 RepID=UPI00272BFEAC|nr:uncharacterized protein LOC131529961 isoform X3 [Onychostoma macrolepis]